ncbi:TonB-dependent receptor domain-containing protein [Cyclobacterium amurskyense]|uniref:TonB-dependent receptor n=1 Tax=Cyclobacterium amurskyense TaxID=320787 RepID=A0A0H4PFP8_9BACT|nr:TonB-dependent receptor [Cyclobacterium amurskyense]AKP53039.1 TonB-dependent receptor [Cyclobacterium amurskyense]
MKRLTKLLLISIIFLAVGSVNSFGQKATEKKEFKISGKVIDKATGEPIPYATAFLKEAGTDASVAGGVADDNGEFFFNVKAAGKYKVELSFVGYDSFVREDVEVGPNTPSLFLGNLGLSESAVSLEEVTVQGQRSLIEEKVDRTIYNAENDKTTAGGDASDVLRRVPMLTVDLDGNVSMRGSSNILVLIDNKQSAIVANNIADALKQIPAEEIKSVEVITSPSAKYDAEGTGGVINIVTKKNKLQGASLNINTSAGLRGSNLGLNVALKKGKMGFSLGGFGRMGYNILGSFENEQTLLSEDAPATRILQGADTRNNMMFGRYNFGWDYEINKLNFMTTSVSFGLRNMRMEQDDLYTETYVEDILVNELLRDVKTDNLSNNVDVSYNYTKSFEKKGKEISFSGLYSRSNRTNDFVNSLYNDSFDQIISRIKNDNNNLNEEFTVQVDYVTPLGSKDEQIIEYGAKNILRKATSDFAYFRADGADGDYVEDEDVDLSNQFNYNQNVTAGYLSYTLGFLEHYTLKTGIRYEYTNIDAEFLSSDLPADIPSYGTVVPNMNFGRKLANGNMLKAAYNRRIQRPSLNYLNPNIEAANPQQITQGNPLLDPEMTDNYELSYSTFIKGTSLNFTSYLRNTTGSIQPVRTIQDDDVIFTTYENIGNERAYGLGIFSNVNISGKFSLNGSIDGYFSQLDNGLSDPQLRAQNEGFVISGRLFGNYTLPRDWQIQAFSFYRGRRVQLQGSAGGFGIYSLSLNKQFAEKRGSIGFGAENFFTPEFKMRNELVTSTITQKSVTGMRFMNFKINFSYRIGKLSVDGGRRKKRGVTNEDLKESEGGSPAMMN